VKEYIHQQAMKCVGRYVSACCVVLGTRHVFRIGYVNGVTTYQTNVQQINHFEQIPVYCRLCCTFAFTVDHRSVNWRNEIAVYICVCVCVFVFFVCVKMASLSLEAF
jgi:hypothetical protein